MFENRFAEYHSYNEDAFNNAEKETLDPKDKEKLETYRKLCIQWDKDILNRKTNAFNTENITELIKRFRTSFQTLGYFFFGGKEKHEELENEYAQTKEGQVDLAHTEANIFNDAFNERAKRLEEATANMQQNPKEFEDALSHFNEFIKDINEGNLDKYSNDINYRKSFRPENKDINPNKP